MGAMVAGSEYQCESVALSPTSWGFPVVRDRRYTLAIRKDVRCFSFELTNHFKFLNV